MKGVVLAAGRGRRIQDITHGGSKCLLQINKKSIIRWNVERLCSLPEVTECIVVVGHDAAAIMYDVGNECNSKRVSYCFQKQQAGLINALEAAKTAIGDSDFFMVLGDEYLIEDNYSEALQLFRVENYSCLIGILEVEDENEIKKTYTFRNQDGQIFDFVEKPEKPFNNLKGTGNVIFRNNILCLLDEVPINPKRGEKELVDLFNLMIGRQLKIGSFDVAKEYFNINTREDYTLLLKQKE